MAFSDRRPVGVSDLAQLARCEQQMLLDLRHGKERAVELERLAEAGKAEHARHDQLARRYEGDQVDASRDRRCFVASAVYGDTAWQTEALRRWRDRVLQPTRWGRALIRLYYRGSPPLVRWLTRYPRLAHTVRGGLDRLIARLGLSVQAVEKENQR